MTQNHTSSTHVTHTTNTIHTEEKATKGCFFCFGHNKPTAQKKRKEYLCQWDTRSSLASLCCLETSRQWASCWLGREPDADQERGRDRERPKVYSATNGTTTTTTTNHDDKREWQSDVTFLPRGKEKQPSKEEKMTTAAELLQQLSTPSMTKSTIIAGSPSQKIRAKGSHFFRLTMQPTQWQPWRPSMIDIPSLAEKIFMTTPYTFTITSNRFLYSKYCLLLATPRRSKWSRWENRTA